MPNNCGRTWWGLWSGQGRLLHALLLVVDGERLQSSEQASRRAVRIPPLGAGLRAACGGHFRLFCSAFLVDLRDADARRLCHSTLSGLSWTARVGPFLSSLP